MARSKTKMHKKHSFLLGLSLAGTLGLAFCNNSPMTTDPTLAPTQEQGPDYGLNHDDILNNIGNIFTDGRQVPPAEGQTLHSCGKLRFNVLTNILKTRGINVTNATVNSAGALLAKAQPVWGVANFPARVPESIRNTTSGLVSLHDILIAAAEEWVPTVAMGMMPSDGPLMGMACTGAKLFNNGTCDKDGFACLMGATPSAQQINLCNSMINDTSAMVMDPTVKRRLAVASMVGNVTMCD